MSPICSSIVNGASSAELFETYDSTLRSLADRFAPVHTIKHRKQLLSPWFDSDCRGLRRHCRCLERRKRRTKDPADRLEWIRSLREKHAAFDLKKEAYWTGKLAAEAGSSGNLWKSLRGVMQTQSDSSNTCVRNDHSPEDFLTAFEKKVELIRTSTEGQLVI